MPLGLCRFSATCAFGAYLESHSATGTVRSLSSLTQFSPPNQSIQMINRMIRSPP
ncbi:infection QTL expressed protein 1 [Heterobasidion irregulare TC 32-1]|uniref:Infection QTL expressed protein 1 n=1 Tax=Heterobasidion irregulare (strain TC 32-1) TaxID=747525 RepID=W4K177_HETIT|nr:infection QTL expressed protein 1 [Heterobasidion irregulare TC 32-1]ETW79567.1 infection QTL expressed protein 1 [Heterobasidion irregulare TC 32-1]